jgi:hypothetical protein
MTTVAEDMAPADKSLLKKLPVENLENASGIAFDRLLLEMLIENLRDALTMTQSAKLVMTGVQEFARQTTQHQAAELKEAETLRKQVG